ncbi:hypothetical protein BBD26_1098 [Lactobacillus delbrueckii subsp. bulgaricus]|nr:hypothetical protein BBD26_1098 [Lactobacillus delbrueckii subsp. bulgaricus]
MFSLILQSARGRKFQRRKRKKKVSKKEEESFKEGRRKFQRRKISSE